MIFEATTIWLNSTWALKSPPVPNVHSAKWDIAFEIYFILNYIWLLLKTTCARYILDWFRDRFIHGWLQTLTNSNLPSQPHLIKYSSLRISHWDEIGIGILPRICPQDPDNNLPVHLPLSWASLMLRLSFIALRRTEYWWSSVSTPLWSFWVSSITLSRENLYLLRSSKCCTMIVESILTPSRSPRYPSNRDAFWYCWYNWDTWKWARL